MTTNKAYLVIDAGGTFFKTCVLKEDGQVCGDSFFSFPSHSDGTLEEVAEGFARCVQQARTFCVGAGLSLCGVGVSMPGPFDYRKGISLMQHKYQCLYRQDVGALVRRALGEDIPVWFVHDVICLIAGEMALGNARGCADVAVITLGTGLGFACAIHGEIQCSDYGSPRSSIYNRPYRDGILEDYVSKRGFLRMYGELGGALTPTLTVKDLAERAGAGEETALRTFREVASILGEAVAPVLEGFGTEILLLGGQIARALPLMLPALEEKLPRIRIAPVSDIDLAASRGVLAAKDLF